MATADPTSSAGIGGDARAGFDHRGAPAGRDALLAAARSVEELARGVATARRLLTASRGPRVEAWLDAAVRLERDQRVLGSELRTAAHALDRAMAAARAAAIPVGPETREPPPTRARGAQAPIAW